MLNATNKTYKDITANHSPCISRKQDFSHIQPPSALRPTKLVPNHTLIPHSLSFSSKHGNVTELRGRMGKSKKREISEGEDSERDFGGHNNGRGYVTVVGGERAH